MAKIISYSAWDLSPGPGITKDFECRRGMLLSMLAELSARVNRGTYCEDYEGIASECRRLVRPERKRPESLRDFARTACAAGGGATLAWIAGEMLDRGSVSKKNGLALIREVIAANPDDVTKTVVALLSDLHPQVAAELPQIRARSLAPQSVVVTASILRRAEEALAEAVRAERNRPAAFDDLLQWTRDDSPLVRWVATAGAQIVVRHTPRDRCRETMQAIFERLEQPPGSTFATTRLLHTLWIVHASEMTRLAATMVSHLSARERECLVASAVDSLEVRFHGRRQPHVPRFVRREHRVVYVPPPRDPWPRFGRALAHCANRDDTLWPLLELHNERLERLHKPPGKALPTSRGRGAAARRRRASRRDGGASTPPSS